MPIIVLECDCGYQQDAYVKTTSDIRNETCKNCGAAMRKGLSMGRGLLYFSEKRPQRILNLDQGQTAITSPKQHHDLCKANHVEPALNWHTGRK